jgi:hypothetical protein
VKNAPASAHRRTLTPRIQGRGRSRAAAILPPTLWFCLLGALVLGPLLLPGYLLLLDSPAGPHTIAPSLLPLPSQGLVSVSAPWLNVLRLVFLPIPELENKLMIFSVIVVGGLGIYRLVTRTLGRTRTAAILGGTLYVVNPFLYERFVSGQLMVAGAYALLPWGAAACIQVARHASTSQVLRASAWTAGIAVVDLHVGGILLLLLLIFISLAPGSWGIRGVWAIAAVAIVFVVHLFWILPFALAHGGMRVASGDLVVYAPKPRDWTILPRVLLLHGFWRTEFLTPLGSSPVRFMAAFIPLIVLAVSGFAKVSRSVSERRLAVGLGGSTLVAVILGMGISFPPTRPVTEFLFRYLPGYGIYREPQKWIALVALAYAIFASIGLDELLTLLRSRSRAEWERILLATTLVPIIATPQILWGFSGQVHTSRFPQDWRRASEHMDEHSGKLLFLPWHLYQPIPFADGRIIANPAPFYFRRPTVTSGSAGFARRNTTPSPDARLEYVTHVLKARAKLQFLGHLLAPLGIRFIALGRMSDAYSYSFLEHQRDLKRIFAGKDLILYSNQAWRGDFYGLARPEAPKSLDEVLGTASGQRGAAEVLAVGDVPADRGLAGPSPPTSLLDWPILPRTSAPLTGTSLSCRDDWQLEGKQPICHLGVVAAFPTAGGLPLSRSGAGIQLLAFLLSFGATIALLYAIRRTRTQHP